jgi:hypothetical protein
VARVTSLTRARIGCQDELAVPCVSMGDPKPGDWVLTPHMDDMPRQVVAVNAYGGRALVLVEWSKGWVPQTKPEWAHLCPHAAKRYWWTQCWDGPLTHEEVVDSVHLAQSAL